MAAGEGDAARSRSTTALARRVECEPSARALELIWRMFIEGLLDVVTMESM
jgi:hypothetical protein